tara:strand:+ start:191 stop:844 length:654 start_codon:yes stop_codon:yes gene_type:complete
MKKHLFILSLLSLCNLTYSQTKWPIWSHHDFDADRVNGLSFGLGSYIDKYTDVNGLKIDIPGIGVFIPMGLGSDPYFESTDSLTIKHFKELQIQLTDSIIFTTNGCYLSLSGDSEGEINGLSVHPIGGKNQISNGISIFGIMGFSTLNQGLMMTVLYSSVSKSKGMIISGMINQVVSMDGLQIGLFNRSLITKGVQIGLWNRNEKRSLPIINWNFEN